MEPIQEFLIPLTFKAGERVNISTSHPGQVYGYGRVECECNGRPDWFYVRFPQGELEMVHWVHIWKAPQE